MYPVIMTLHKNQGQMFNCLHKIHERVGPKLITWKWSRPINCIMILKQRNIFDREWIIYYIKGVMKKELVTVRFL